MKIISVANRKGGVGKTTTAINLGAALAAAGKKILLIDFDPQGNATTSLGVDKKRGSSSYEMLIGDCRMTDSVIASVLPGLDLIPSSPDLAAAEVELVNRPSREYALKKAFDPIDSKYDYVLIDCPPSLNLITINALSASDSVIVPLQCEFLALEGLADLMKNINAVKRNFNPPLRLEGILLTMYGNRNNLSRMIDADVRKYFGDKVYDTVIPRSIRIAEAPSYGQSVLAYDPKSAGALSYVKLAKEFLEREKEI